MAWFNIITTFKTSEYTSNSFWEYNSEFIYNIVILLDNHMSQTSFKLYKDAQNLTWNKKQINVINL